MNASCYFHMGHAHTVCQDYALATAVEPVGSGLKLALVSDGCSSSPHTDVGARLIATQALQWVNSWGRSARDYALWTPEGLQIIAKLASNFALASGLPSSAADATLFGVIGDANGFHVLTTGDGVVYARSRSGQADQLIEIEFPSGAPGYINYLVHPTRKQVYLSDGGSQAVRVIRTAIGGSETGLQTQQEEQESLAEGDWNWPRLFGFSAEHYDLVAVASDGLRSFRRRVGHMFEDVPLTEVAPRVFGFKNHQGDFVVRRLRRFLTKECPELGWHHDDDVAVAALHMD